MEFHKVSENKIGCKAAMSKQASNCVIYNKLTMEKISGVRTVLYEERDGNLNVESLDEVRTRIGMRGIRYEFIEIFKYC